MEVLTHSDSLRLSGVPVSKLIVPRDTGSRIALPVENYTVFTTFKHVEGVPAGDSPGYSVSKLQILDAVIEQLINLKQKEAVAFLPEDRTGLSERAVDALIQELATKLKVTSTASAPPNPAPSLGPAFGMAVSQTGSVVNALV